MTKYKLVIEAVVNVPEGEKFPAKKAAKCIKEDYSQFLPEDCASYLPEGSKIGKVTVVIEPA